MPIESAGIAAELTVNLPDARPQLACVVRHSTSTGAINLGLHFSTRAGLHNRSSLAANCRQLTGHFAVFIAELHFLSKVMSQEA